MNVYGRAMTDGKRQAHSNVVEMILKPADNPTTEVAEAALWLLWSKVVLDLRREACNRLKELVAGEGFEPSTFGL